MKRSLLILAFLLGGCATQLQVVDKATKPILVREPVTRGFHPPYMGTVQLPAGIYQPDFQSAEGVYYRVPSAIVLGAAGFHRVTKGGLFVPFSPSELQACWIDEVGQGDIISFASMQPSRRWLLQERVPYTTVDWSTLAPHAGER